MPEESRRNALPYHLLYSHGPSHVLWMHPVHPDFHYGSVRIEDTAAVADAAVAAGEEEEGVAEK